MDSSALQTLTPQQHAEYDRIRAKGQSHNIALILACRSAPKTDRTDERWRGADDRKDHGKGAPLGKYQTGLARYPGDPMAFVRSRAEARKRAEQLGLDIVDPAAIYDDLNDPERNGQWPEDDECYAGFGLF